MVSSVPSVSGSDGPGGPGGPVSLPLSAKAEVLRTIAGEIPLDQYGFPQYIYRPDFIPVDLLSDSMEVAERHNHLANASVRISYDEGFPTLPGGEPFWHQFPWEPAFAYQKFADYLESAHNAETPVRSLHTLATLTGAPLDELKNSFHLYWWRARAKAHDMFEAACHRQLIRRRIMSMERSQYDYATSFLALTADYLKRAFEAPEDYDLRPGDVIRLQGQMLGAQRVALGLNAQGGGGRTDDTLPPGATVEVFMRQALKNGGGDSGEAEAARNENRDVKALLESPEAIEAAQDLIIRFSSAGEGGRTREGAHFLDHEEREPGL